jgi:hypothetical protein
MSRMVTQAAGGYKRFYTLLHCSNAQMQESMENFFRKTTELADRPEPVLVFPEFDTAIGPRLRAEIVDPRT